MSSLAGTGALVRLGLRRDRILLPSWLAVFVLMAGSSALATVDLYPSAGERMAAADAVNRSQALVAMYGRVYDPSSIGAISMIKMGGIGAVFVALLAVVLTVRHTRADEESGRLELVGAAATGRHAPLAAGLTVVVVTNVVLALLTGLALTASGLPLDGSFAFGVAWGGVGLAFAAIAAVAAQLTTSARTATSISATVLAVVYVLRAVGDTASPAGPRWLTWLSPIGWGQQFRPYAGNRWWVLLITVAFAGVVVAGAFALASRRDLGTGLLPGRPGRPAALPSLRTPLALAWRLQRGALLGWAVGFLLLGAVLGTIVSDIGGFLNSPSARDLITTLGGEKALTDAFLALELSIAGIVAAAYGIQSVLRLRAEETELRAEPVLAGAVGRLRWAAGHVAVAVGGTTVLMACVGAGAGLAHGARVGDMGQAGRVFVAALVQLPAAWVLVGITVAAFGLTPRLAAVGWIALTVFLLLGEFGGLFGLDQWVMDLSPFAHTPRLPGVPVSAAPLVVLTILAAALGAGGLAALRRRDIA
jgi:ABC-2 type transport system permease protein